MTMNKRTTSKVALFDDSAGYDDDSGVRLAEGLTEDERHEATLLYHLFNELMGIILVLGDPGAGKDTFGNWLQFTLKRYFSWKRFVRDEFPRSTFGEYDGVFDDNFIIEQLSTYRKIAKGKIKELEEDEDHSIDKWFEESGQALLDNSVTYLTEFWRYCARQHQKTINKTMGGIFKMKRHLNLLVIGTGQIAADLDPKNCLKWIDWRVTCVKSNRVVGGFTFIVQKVRYDRHMDELVPIGRPFPISIDAAKPRAFIGDGKIKIRKPKYLPETEEERIVLDVLKTGIDTYDELVDFIETHGDMTEEEILATLKHLRFGKSRGRLKYIIEYNCYWTIYNSRSAPQLTTSLKIVN